MSKPKHIHFIGICGVAMSAIAIALKKKGYTISGSDAGFFPPVSTNLKENKIDFYPGWHPEKMVQNGLPDLVVVGNVVSSTNPEFLYVNETSIPYLSYPEIIEKFFIKENSLVCAGTYGKTSSTALLSFILENGNLDPSYMFGGLTIDLMIPAKIGNGSWSVVEGDEYKSARFDNSPKFSHYSPTHLLLSGLSWDHADIYETEEKYFTAFRDLILNIPENGLIVACIDNETIIELIKNAKCKVITYGISAESDYQFSIISLNSKGLKINVSVADAIYQIDSPLLGDYQAQNIVGCFAMAKEIGLKTEIILESLKRFTGLKRRMEKRFEGISTIIDDIAHSPIKASATIQTLKKIYKEPIIIVYEPNTGNRKKDAAFAYANAFQSADEVIIPKLTKLKNETNDESIMNGEELTKIISESHLNCHYFPEDEKLVDYLSNKKYHVIAFLGSHGFRGMIEDLVTKIKK